MRYNEVKKRKRQFFESKKDFQTSAVSNVLAARVFPP